MAFPALLPDIEEGLKKYLICPEHLPIHRYENNQEFWQREIDVSSLFNCDISPISTTLKVLRDHGTGKILKFLEVPVEGVGSNSKNSFSLSRAPAPLTDSVRGEPINFPFWPGGFPDTAVELPKESDSHFSELLTIPPGFQYGLQFEEDGYTVTSSTDETKDSIIKIIDANEDTVNLLDLIEQEQDLLNIWSEPKENSSDETTDQKQKNLEIEADVLPTEHEIPILKITDKAPVKSKNLKWAFALDSQEKITDFKERIPDMAFEYPFELDTFQKQAILKLEENRDVFVAAHTSAGKTVVAEYAIAMSQKHQTRTIYTSPIKALSNQKYRDFKKTFNDVGLITGDFQMNQSATCLIMTTEILRSMLYCGSEVIRDLEYVIFDEVHYINDPERGHVWEEVIILLPSHVRIVLLSATVPNSMQFANWIGCIKQRIVYVISTLHRPVPLQHFLYTGTGGKSKDQRYLIIDDKGDFKLEGYNAAIKSVLVNPNKHSTQNSEKTFWVAFVHHLSSKDLLPTVVFKFSRAKCDKTAQKLLCMDMTTAKEKSKIHSFYQVCMNLLKEPDRELPQVKMMHQLLQKGIGVHHSGILPILKEIVEILFQKGLIKVLFATETFAMGVNMPAKTVVFDNILKYDGKEMRLLKPGEYIQMAGRAGRRGLDKTGTVIIRVTQDQVKHFHESKLKYMMLGEPQLLESQFRLTYNMLLSLLRVESLNVENVMEKSFSEIKRVQSAIELDIAIRKTETEYATECTKDLGEHHQQLVCFYDAAKNVIELWKKTMPGVLQHPKVVKYLVPGRVLIVNHKNQHNKLALLLSIKKNVYKVLVLDDQKEKSDEIQLTVANNMHTQTEEKTDESLNEMYRMLSFTERLYQPTGIGGHTILNIPPEDIIEIVKRTIKVDTDFIIKEWDMRQIPRFQDYPTGQTCEQGIQELTKINMILLENTASECYNPITDFHIDNLDLIMDISELYKRRIKVECLLSATKIANLEERFTIVFKRKYLENMLNTLKFQNSNKSLALYSEYEKRIELLRELKYINDQNRVEMKGKVACRIGMNELLITELVFHGKLTNLQPAEVAALLSALVLQVESKEKIELPKNLAEGQEKIQEIIDEIASYKRKHKIVNDDEIRNFALVEVVYEWAKEKSFADIMKLTDFQEGTIVRCIQQLNELLRDVRDAAKVIGDPVLQAKMEEASNLIKRDIVFTASLYTQKEAISF